MKKIFVKLLVLCSLLFTLSLNPDTPVITIEETAECVKPASDIPFDNKGTF